MPLESFAGLDDEDIEVTNQIEGVLTPGFESKGNKFKFGATEEVKEESDSSSSCESEKKDTVRKHLWKKEEIVKESKTGSVSGSEIDISEQSAYDENKSYSCDSYDFTNSFEEIDFEDVGCQANISVILRSISVQTELEMDPENAIYFGKSRSRPLFNNPDLVPEGITQNRF